MEIHSEKNTYGNLFKHVSPNYEQDIFLWGEDLINKHLYVYSGKIKNLPEYDTFADRLVNCGLVVIDRSKSKKITCHAVRYDNTTEVVYVAEKNFQSLWPLLKKSVRLGISLAKQNGTECHIRTPEDIVSLHYLQCTTGNPVLKNDRIIYRAKELSPEEKRLHAARQSALDNRKNIYFYSKTEGYVHDRQCEQIKEIRLEDFIGSDQFPEGREYCPYCARQIFLRIGCSPVTKTIPVCNRIFTKYRIKTNLICRLVMEYGMKFHANSLSEITIRCGEDTWIIEMSANGLKLWHNNYVRISPTGRYITEGFHDQNLSGHPSMYQMLLYIAGYSWQEHLAAEHRKEESESINPEEMTTIIFTSEPTEAKTSLLRRLVAYIKGLFHI